MSIVPLFIVITVILSFFATDYHLVVNLINELFPNITSQFLKLVDYLSKSRAIFGIVGFIIAFYFSNSIFTSLHSSIVYVFEKPGVSMKKTALIHIFAVPIFITSLIVIYISLLLISSIIDIISNSVIWEYLKIFLGFFEIDWLLDYIIDISKISSFLVFFIILFAIYYYFPPVSSKNVGYILITNISISVFLVILKMGFNYYIVFASKTNPIYGSLSGIFAFLAWLYLSYSFILIGSRTLYYLYQNSKSRSL